MLDSNISSDYIGKQLRYESGEYLRYSDGRIIREGDIVDYKYFGLYNCQVVRGVDETYVQIGTSDKKKTLYLAKPSDLEWKSSEIKTKGKQPSSSSSNPPPNVIDLVDDEAESEPESGEF